MASSLEVQSFKSITIGIADGKGKFILHVHIFGFHTSM